MLGKLIKWEFKDKKGTFIGMYIFAAICALITFGVSVVREHIGGGMFIGTIETMCVTMTFLAVCAMFAVIIIVSVIRYYENLVKDEGYLMHTIPVTAVELHMTKLIVPLVWMAGAVVIAIVCAGAVFANTFTVNDVIELVFKSEFSSVVWYMIGYMILAAISTFSTFYVCINVGSLSYSNKGVMAFVTYIVIYIINQVLSTITMLISMLILFAGEEDMWAAMNAPTPPDGYFEVVFTGAGIVSLIGIVAYNLISLYILKNKVNLE